MQDKGRGDGDSFGLGVGQPLLSMRLLYHFPPFNVP
jgi:hypothetical protein